MLFVILEVELNFSLLRLDVVSIGFKHIITLEEACQLLREPHFPDRHFESRGM
jgi:hypothetical protein